MQQLLELLQFEPSAEGRVRRMLQFLSTHGFKQQFELLEQDLRDCLVQLSTILSLFQLTSEVRHVIVAAHTRHP
jgi:hypothetical protein